MRRRSSGPAVALFPFLAVLLCAMGALILLLLVLARQVREEALHEEALHVEMPLPAPAAPVPVAPAETLAPPPEIPTIAVVVPAPAREPAVDPNDALKVRLKELTEAQADAAQDVEQARSAIAEQSDGIRTLEAAVSAAKFDVEANRQRLAARTLSLRDVEAKQRDLQGAIESSRKRLQTVRQTAATAEPKVTVVPYDGIYGTSRRPILIECTDEAIRFLPEGVELTARDLEGFQTDDNPLLAGVVALREHWIEIDGPSSPKPYVLLLVRENGVAAYYAARTMLQSLDGETGYELLTDDLSLALPTIDPDARETCRNAVDDVLQNGRTGRVPVAGKPLFPSGRFEIDPGDHDPTGPEPSPLARRSLSRRSTASRPPPANPLGGRSAVGGDTSPDVPLPQQRPLPTFARGAMDGGPRDQSALDRSVADVSAPSIEPRSASSLSGVGEHHVGEQSVGEHGAREHKGSEYRVGERRGDERHIDEQGRRRGGDVESGQSLIDRLPQYGVAPAKRRWGLSAPTSNIALERPVSLLVTSDEIVVGVQPSIPVADGITPETVRAVYEAIDKDATAWGRAPGQFYWSPRLKATVRPGGTGHLDHLQRELGRSGLRMSSEIVLAPATPTFLELNHGETAP